MLSNIIKVNKEYVLTEQQVQKTKSNEVLLDNLNFIKADKVKFKLVKFCSNYQFELELLYFRGDELVASQIITEYLSNHFPPFVKVFSPKEDKGELIGYISNQNVFENSTVIVENVELVMEGELLKNLQCKTSFSLSNREPTLTTQYYFKGENIFEEVNILSNYIYALTLYDSLSKT